MKGNNFFIIALICAFSLTGMSPAQSAQYITGYTTGKVTEYEQGKTLEVLDHEGTRKEYFVPETAEIPKDLKVGDKVEVKEVGKAAVGVEILSREKK